jgi:adenosylmethionine-8-amino-7-oxononanoate aminotransferase
VDEESARDWSFIPSPQPFPRIARAEGPYLYTDGGHRILDAAGGAIVCSIGQGRPEVAAAAAEAMRETSYVVPPFLTESRARLLERIKKGWLPPDLTRVAFTSGGSESGEFALRLARHHHVAAGRPERHKIIGRDLSYHGTTLATLAVGGHEKRRKGLEPLLLESPRIPACYCLRCPLDRTYPGCEVACATELEALIEREGPETIAAFIAEPIGGSTAGALVPPDEYWPTVAEICRRHGILLIADEVMTGFGRTGRRFAAEHWDLRPDILMGGKGLTSGYAPMGCVFATDAVVAPIAERRESPMFYTYSAHPAACAAADAVLDIIEREDLVARAARVGHELKDRLSKLEAHPHVAEVRGLGLLLAVELCRDRATLEPFPVEARMTDRVVGAGLGRGVFFYPSGCGPARDAVAIGPPFTIGSEEIETIVTVLEASIDDAAQRFLARTS